MTQNLIIIVGLFVLSIISGMLGLGVAFSAVPFLGLFFNSLVHQIQPLSLILNGVTALFAVIGFAKSGYVLWKKAMYLAVVTAFGAPIGSFMAQSINQTYIWYIYFAAVAYLAYIIFKPVKEENEGEENFNLALTLAFPISILSGLLGVGPGFLLLPTLIILGFKTKQAAGINAFAVILPSFSALIPHFKTAQIDFSLALWFIVAGAVGSYLGARITSKYLPDKKVKQFFGIVLVLITLYKIYTLRGS